MKQIIYYVAVSLDGYIAGPKNDISSFILQGPGVDQYQSDLQSFNTVIMGRKTYEFGYQFGLPPGQPAYPNMEHHIFSNSLRFENKAASVHVQPLDIDIVKKLKQESTTDIYLCGGGIFASWLLRHGQIDQLKLKVNPIVLGEGTKLFHTTENALAWNLVACVSYEDGMQVNSYTLRK